MDPAAGGLPPFDEARWQTEQREREARLFQLMRGWLDRQALPPALLTRVARRVLHDGPEGRTDCPSLYAMRLAEALEAPPPAIEALAVAATLFWAAADAADDVDDDEPAPEGEAPTANDACALLFLAQQALLELSPGSARLGSEYGLRMAGGQAVDLATTDRPRPPDLDALARDKAGAEGAFFFRLAGQLAGVDSPVLAELGEAFGYAVQVFTDVADLYLKPVSPDFVAGKWTWPLFHFREKSAGAAAPLEAFPRHWPDVLMRVRAEAAPGCRLSLERCTDGLQRRWEQARPLCRRPAPMAEAVAWLLATIAAVHGALEGLEAPPPPRRVPPREALSRAIDFLGSGDAAEEHRWGLFGRPYVAGNLYPLLWKAVALRETGTAWEELLERLLALRDEDGWRYYPGQREIPPDADDTGLILGEFGDRLPAGVREASVRQLVDSFEGATIHTWMGEMPKDFLWEGDDCLATLANACWGLLRAGRGGQVPPAVRERLVGAAAADQVESPFYPPALTRYFLHRALAEASGRQHLPDGEARKVREALEQHMKAAERLAGNFGPSVLSTAATVLAAGAWRLPLRRAALETWLCERQESDGSWAAEPFTRTPGVNFREQRWGAAATTTCWVVLALLTLREG